VPHWFAFDGDLPLFAFAGIWWPWTGVRGKEAGEHLLYGFLTTEPNAVVRPVHAKAMLTTPEEWDVWLRAPANEALALQCPLPAERPRIVASGELEDPPTGAAAAKSTPKPKDERAPELPLFASRL
jgi:putative SOS response-associated peptidase YedK